MMTTDPLVVATTTVEKQAQADDLARRIIDARLAACVQIDGPITSHYVWDRSLQRSAEWRLTIKTLASAAAALSDLVHRIHPYDTPQWVVLPTLEVSPDYYRWVQNAVQEMNVS
jgi:periplasmic divalent cation tolerance protein